MTTISTIHVAAIELRIGPLQRQVCAWCGLRLIDVDVRNIAVPDGQSPWLHAWEVGGLVEVTDGNPTGYVALPHPEDGKLPDNACCPPEARRPKLALVSPVSTLPPVPRGHCKRCDRCGWTFADSQKGGCVPGNCSFRDQKPTPLRDTCAGCGAPFETATT
jgi:hypothetical protein